MPNNPIQEPTPEQHEALHKIIDKLPLYSESFADHTSCTQTIASLREMLASQGRVSEQHVRQVQKLAGERDHAIALREADKHWAQTYYKKTIFWKEVVVRLRQDIVNLYDRYDNGAAQTYERVFNSILDTEEDPNPGIADDERDRWLVEQTWLATISTMLDLMPAGDGSHDRS